MFGLFDAFKGFDPSQLSGMMPSMGAETMAAMPTGLDVMPEMTPIPPMGDAAMFHNQVDNLTMGSQQPPLMPQTGLPQQAMQSPNFNGNPAGLVQSPMNSSSNVDPAAQNPIDWKRLSQELGKVQLPEREKKEAPRMPSPMMSRGGQMPQATPNAPAQAIGFNRPMPPWMQGGFTRTAGMR